MENTVSSLTVLTSASLPSTRTFCISVVCLAPLNLSSYLQKQQKGYLKLY